MANPVEIVSLGVSAWAQWRIGRTWLFRSAESGPPRRSKRLLLAIYYCLLATALLVGYPRVYKALNLGRNAAGLTGGAAHLWLYGCAAAWFLYAAMRFARARLAPSFSPARRRVLNAAGGALVMSPLVAVGYGALIERTSFRVREIEVPVADLPPDLNGLRLVQLSDIHLSAFLSEAELERVIDAANETRPHLAVVTGDMISTRGDPLDACLRQLSRLRAEAGVVGCMGNHEDYAHAKLYATREGARLGISFLRGEGRQIRFGNSSLHVAGVDYEPISRRRNYLAGAAQLLVPGMPNILLSHNPDVLPVAAAQGWDLTLSGHTHGGQVTVEILDQSINPARFFTPYIYGLFREGGKYSYVTRGIGTIGIPARIGAPPEIALLRLKRA